MLVNGEFPTLDHRLVALEILKFYSSPNHCVISIPLANNSVIPAGECTESQFSISTLKWNLYQFPKAIGLLHVLYSGTKSKLMPS